MRALWVERLNPDAPLNLLAFDILHVLEEITIRLQ